MTTTLAEIFWLADRGAIAWIWLGATLVFVVTALVVWLSRHRSAALRHRLLTLGQAAVLLLPLGVWLLPGLGLAWRWNQSIVDASHPHAPTQIDIAGTSSAVAAISNDVIVAAMTSSPKTREEEEYANPPDHVTAIHNHVDFPFAATRDGDSDVSRATAPPLVVQPEAKSTSRSRIDQLTDAASATWLAGIVVGLVLLIRGLSVAARMTRRAIRVADSNTLAALDRLRDRLGITQTVRLICSPETRSPFAVGWLRPSIVLPSGFARWPQERLTSVLAHELAHVQRRDVLCQLVSRLACAVYWCHPLVWIANARIRVEREFACDDVVLRIGGAPESYARDLTAIAQTLLAHQHAPALVASMANGHSLESRIRAILQLDRDLAPLRRATDQTLFAGMIAVVIAIVLVGPSAERRSADLSLAEFATTELVSKSASSSQADDNQTPSGEAKADTLDTASQSANPNRLVGHQASEVKPITGLVVDEQEQPAPNANGVDRPSLQRITRFFRRFL